MREMSMSNEPVAKIINFAYKVNLSIVFSNDVKFGFLCTIFLMKHKNVTSAPSILPCERLAG